MINKNSIFYNLLAILFAIIDESKIYSFVLTGLEKHIIVFGSQVY